MKRTRYSEEQIIGILQEHEAGAKCADLCRKHGMSEGTFYAWKAKYSGMTVSEAKRLKALEDENAKLKKLLAEQMLDMAAMKELLQKKMVTPAVKREAVAHLKAHLGLSERACLTLPGRIARWCATSRSARPTRPCAGGCGIWPMNGAGSATGGSSCCSGAKARRRGSTASTGFTAKKG